MARIKIWNRVPDGSILHVAVEGGTGSTEGFLAESDGDGRALSNAELRAGVPIPLTAPVISSVGLVLTFSTPSTFTVIGRVEKPDATGHGTAYREDVAGQAGQVVAVNIVAITLQS